MSLRSANIAAALAAGLLLWLPGAARAQTGEIIATVTAERFAAILKDAGYRAEIVEGDRPRGRTGIGGYNVVIYFYDCKQGCAAFQFYSGFKKSEKHTLAYVNRWNTEKRYGKAYLDKDGDLAFEFDVDLDGGVGPQFIKEKILLYERLLSEFDKF